jgi:hypothetical protein
VIASAQDTPPQASPDIEYGYREEWADFQKRNPEFLQRFPNLEHAIHVAFDRVHVKTELWQRTVYFLGRLGVEEFSEILLLCGNGYGFGAEKLVRGMYERAVTTNYLCLHPEEAKEFKAFERIADYKLMKSVLASGCENAFSKEQVTKIEQEYAAVKDQFVVTNSQEVPDHSN